MTLIHRVKKQLSLLKKSSKGFTLLELMISLVIFTVGVLGVAIMQGQSVTNHTFSEYVSQNNNAATDQIEEFMATDYTDARIVTPGTRVSADGRMNIGWIPPAGTSLNSRLLFINSIYTGCSFTNRNDPTIIIPIIKPFVN